MGENDARGSDGGGSILGVPLEQLHRDRTSVKWRRYGPEVIPLWIAEMDCAPCPAVVDAVSISGYYTMVAMLLNTARTPLAPGVPTPLPAFP